MTPEVTLMEKINAILKFGTLTYKNGHYEFKPYRQHQIVFSLSDGDAWTNKSLESLVEGMFEHIIKK